MAIIGEKDNEAALKTVAILEDMKVPFENADAVQQDKLNIYFTKFEEPLKEQDALVIYCPLLDIDEDRAESALNFLKHTDHGLWVGINNGANAAIAAVQILNKDGAYAEQLSAHRESMKQKIKDANEGLDDI